MKIKRLFLWKQWMRTGMIHLGIVLFIYGLFRISSGVASAYWLLVSYVVTQVFMLGLTVGNHRLFSHHGFKTSEIWKWIMALLSPISGNNSSFNWTFTHLGHHKFSDTYMDPYQNDLSFFFALKHKDIKFELDPRVRGMLREKKHFYTHKYALLLVLITALLCYSVSLNCLIFGYLIPAAMHQITGNLLVIYTHKDNKPVDRPWYWGIFIPSAGEWFHLSHHEAGKERRLNYAQAPKQWDFGYWFVKLIATNKVS